LVLLVVFTTSNMIYAQQGSPLNAYKVADIGKKTQEQIDSDDDKPLPYGYIADRDVLWSKVVWEYVDLNQKINLIFLTLILLILLMQLIQEDLFLIP